MMEAIIDKFEAGKGKDIQPGPQIDRIYSAPVGGLTSLIEAPAKSSGKSSGSKAASKKAAPKKKQPTKPAKLAGSAQSATKKPALTTGSTEKGKPKAIRKPAKPDDLKLISGVGPKLEGVLNGLGIYKFSQVSEWKKAERDWVDGFLNFKGRIDRDDWVRQAKALAKDGVDEYVRVFGKKPR